jgi:hypothetical protein
MGRVRVVMSRILSAWDPDLSVIIGCVALALVYAFACDLTPNPFPFGKGNQAKKRGFSPSDSPSFKGRRWVLGLQSHELILFLLGDLVMLLALISPLDVLADE